MVEIVSPPSSRYVKCRCGAQLRFQQSEVKEGTSYHYDYSSETYYYIDCPLCGQRAHVKRFEQ